MASNDRTFDETTAEVVDWGRANAAKIAGVVGAVVIVLGGAALWRSSASTKATRGERAFFEAQAPLAAGNVGAAQQQLRQVAQRYGGTAGGTQAQLLLAQTLYDQGKYQEGLDVLANASGGPDPMRSSVDLLSAVGYEGLGKYDEAAKRYEQAAGKAPTPMAKASLMGDQARALQSGGKNADALRVWEEIVKQQLAGMSDEARVRAGELRASTKS